MEMDAETISGFFEDNTTNFSSSAASPDDIFSVLEAWENASDGDAGGKSESLSFEFHKSSPGAAAPPRNSDPDSSSSAAKRRKLTNSASASQMEEGQNRISHITVERNRRKQMNEHLSVLRSLMPCFYVKRGDQASIIGGVVDYINELQQVLQSLEAKKQRKSAYNDVVLSPRIVSSSPRPSPLSPRLPPLSPRTPQSSAPYKPWMHHSPSLPSPVDPSPSNSSASSSINDAVNELVATSKSALAEVEVKFSGPNLLLKTVSPRRAPPGQVLKIVSALEELALEILHVSISTVDETVLNSFTIKIGIQCQLSAEELAEQIQHTFCS